LESANNSELIFSKTEDILREINRIVDKIREQEGIARDLMGQADQIESELNFKKSDVDSYLFAAELSESSAQQCLNCTLWSDNWKFDPDHRVV
jgi:hypothetical protein